MASLRSAISAYKRYGLFNNSELLMMAVSSFVMAFIISFNKWGEGANFEFGTGLRNLIIFFTIAYMTQFVMFTGQRFAAVQFGLIPKYRTWGTGMGISLLIGMVTNGIPGYLQLGGQTYDTHEGLQLGRWWKGPQRKFLSYIVFWGFFSIIVYCSIIQLLPFINGKDMIIFWTLVISAMSLIPLDMVFSVWQKNLPHSNGTILFAGRGDMAFFTLFFFGTSCALIWFVGIWTIPVAILLGGFAFVMWWFKKLGVITKKKK